MSLSTYFPRNTSYFYGYPAGNNTDFVNKVPAEEEELVSMRPNSCAGPEVNVISYSPMTSPLIDQTLFDKLDIPQNSSDRPIYLPLYITPELSPIERNEAVKQALTNLTTNNSLVMAQPYPSRRLRQRYRIKPELAIYLNNKQNLEKFIPAKFLPERLASFTNGRNFVAGHKKLSLPFVAKVSLSSSGDGVYICQEKSDLDHALAELKSVTSSIIVERYVEATKNYALHFGIPQDKSKSIDILGLNEQLTDKYGNFLGGIIRGKQMPSELLAARHELKQNILPKVRQTGWYGVGGFDVIVDAAGKCYFIDGNFRMTGTTAYHFLVVNRKLEPPFVTLSGQFTGSRQEFEERVVPLCKKGSPDKIMQIIALSEHNNVWRFNAALNFKDELQLQARCHKLISAGVSSSVLVHILAG